MSIRKSRIREIVEDVVDRGLPQGDDRRPPLEDDPSYAGRELITEQEVMNAHREGRALFIAPDAVVTPSARDAMARYGVKEASSPAVEKVVETVRGALSAEEDSCGKGQVAIGADHGGFEMKQLLVKFLEEEAGIRCVDLGTHSPDPVDYPDFAARVAREVSEGRCCRGIVVDGAGIGSAMAANKVRGVRAAHCSNVVEARNAREHNDANVLTLGGRVIGPLLAKAIAAVFLKTDFGGGRHQGRVNKIVDLEQ